MTRTTPGTAARQPAARKAAPALSPKARALVDRVNREEAERAARVQKAIHAALALTEPPQPKPAVRKSKDDPDKALVAVYTSDGTLCGVVAQGKITYLAQPPTPASAAQPASGTAQDGGPRQAPPTQAPAPQAGPAAAAAAAPAQPTDPSQPGVLPTGDQDDAEAVTKALTATLRERVVKGTPREAQDAFDALQALAMVRFAQIRAGGGQKQMKR